MVYKISFSTLVILFLACFFSSPALGQEGDPERLQSEEAEDYYQKWLKEDVVYIITDEEKDVFEGLTTPEEKEQFIEQFWHRRDSDLRTPINEFKEEHYRRIAYANERFSSGYPGWMTDRGRIYIIHGEPAEIESHPSGGNYQRPIHEGGGSTSTYPFEIWRYRHIDSLGSDIILEFVDPTFSGEYRLALRPEEKDALLHVPGAGATLAEQMGLATKADRPYFSPGNRETYPMMFQRARDNPFTRYETYAKVQSAQPIKYKDLKELVEVNVAYDSLPFNSRQDFFRLNEQQVLVPLTIQLRNKDLSFTKEGEVHVARVAVYGIVTSITNRIVTEFEDDLLISYQDDFLEKGLTKLSVYQKILPLERKMRYKLDLVVKDLASGNVGVERVAIVPPKHEEDELDSSTLILSSYIQPLQEIPTQDEMFVIGDVKVRPNMNKEFLEQQSFGVYLQLYNVELDQTSLSPSLTVTYQLLKDGEVHREIVDESGESTQFFSTRRVVLVKALSLEGLEPGKYKVQVIVRDRISDQRLTVADEFSVVNQDQYAALN